MADTLIVVASVLVALIGVSAAFLAFILVRSAKFREAGSATAFAEEP